MKGFRGDIRKFDLAAGSEQIQYEDQLVRYGTEAELREYLTPLITELLDTQRVTGEKRNALFSAMVAEIDSARRAFLTHKRAERGEYPFSAYYRWFARTAMHRVLQDTSNEET